MHADLPARALSERLFESSNERIGRGKTVCLLFVFHSRRAKSGYNGSQQNNASTDVHAVANGHYMDLEEHARSSTYAHLRPESLAITAMTNRPRLSAVGRPRLRNVHMVDLSNWKRPSKLTFHFKTHENLTSSYLPYV